MSLVTHDRATESDPVGSTVGCSPSSHAALSGFENGGKRVFDIGALADCDDASYDALEPVQWPCVKGVIHSTPSRLFAEGGFPTSDGRACMIALADGVDDDDSTFPLTLNTGRIRDQWHTMTRTGKVPRLMAHVTGPQLAIHPRDAEACGVTADGLVRVDSEQGSLVMRAVVTETQRQGEVFAPMHWTDQFSSACAVARLVHDKADPVSGQPDLKRSRVRVCAIETLWTGLLCRRTQAVPELGDCVYWSKAPIDSGFAFDLAGWSELTSVFQSERILRRLLQIPVEAELVSYSDPKKSVFRYAGLMGGQLEACLFLAPSAAGLLARDSAAPFLGRTLDPVERLSLLAAHMRAESTTPDSIVCACFSVCAGQLASAIRKKNLRNVEDVGAALQAGTNCGSCIPELKKLLLQETRASSGLLRDGGGLDPWSRHKAPERETAQEAERRTGREPERG